MIDVSQDIVIDGEENIQTGKVSADMAHLAVEVHLQQSPLRPCGAANAISGQYWLQNRHGDNQLAEKCEVNLPWFQTGMLAIKVLPEFCHQYLQDDALVVEVQK